MFLSPANGTGEVAACLDPQRSLDLPRENCPAPRLLAGNAHSQAPTQSHLLHSRISFLRPALTKKLHVSFRHKKEKKKDKDRERDRDRDRKDDRERNREKRERSTSKKSKDKDKDRDRKSDSEKGDVKVRLSCVYELTSQLALYTVS